MVDDRPTRFWMNGARVIAYDIPEWRLSTMNGGEVPSEARRRVVEEQACAALKYLDEARMSHPRVAAIWVEQGNIELYRRGDLRSAAECYRRAAELPDAPYYAARIHAELLRRLGREQEAYVWLRRLHPTLPSDDQAAMSELVLRRIRDLEGRLHVPEKERYVPMSLQSDAARRKKLD
jgi:tetratricopeptide (TPR) repeat protein